MRVGFDIGGTFTDIVVVDDDGHLSTTKVLSLLETIGESIVHRVNATADNAKVDAFVHGTTIASNAVIEDTVARTGLITTEGFRDELEMRGQRRPNIYDAEWDRLPPLVPRSLRLEVAERVLGDGTVEVPLNSEQAKEVIHRLLDERVQAIAVCFINSYLNSKHEKEIGKLIREIAPDAVVGLSCEVHPEIREYERTSTTVINTSLVPVVREYLDRLESHLATLSNRLLIMQSNGGIMSAEAARRRPAYMIESGPAAGVLAAGRFAKGAGLEQVLSFDMGGTTAKACLIEDGDPLEKPGGESGGGATATTTLFGGGGHALRVPSLDIVEVGAGGGSIAWVDRGGALRVGPQSASADPGPVCYGRGGSKPTVTDANVVLGYMNPEAIAGSTITIDRDAAWDAIEENIATPLGLPVLRTALGITQVANATMMRALRAVSTERGRDPRDCTMIAFGGAGPVHAAALADSLGIEKVVVPIYPGLFSALGLLLADYRHDYIKSFAEQLDSSEASKISRAFDELKQAAFEEFRKEGIPPGKVELLREVDMKYSYQVSEMSIPFPNCGESEIKNALAKGFSVAHRRAFGYARDDVVELVSLRLRATTSVGETTFSSGRHVADATIGESRSGNVTRESGPRNAYFGDPYGKVRLVTYRRGNIKTTLAGPLIVEEPDTTVVVPPRWYIRRQDDDSLLLSREECEQVPR